MFIQNVKNKYLIAALTKIISKKYNIDITQPALKYEGEIKDAADLFGQVLCYAYDHTIFKIPEGLSLTLEGKHIRNTELLYREWFEKNLDKILKIAKIEQVSTEKTAIKNGSYLQGPSFLGRTTDLKNRIDIKKIVPPLYMKYKDAYWLLNGNHRRHLLNKAGYKKMDAWVLDFKDVKTLMGKTGIGLSQDPYSDIEYSTSKQATKFNGKIPTFDQILLKGKI